MILFPAIDLKDGCCVRLKRGEMSSATVFNADPAAQAQIFASAGFKWLHCVDLDGAFAGRSANGEAVRAIRAAVQLPIQLGGGIRDRAAIEAWLEEGISRVILGTAALRDPELVRDSAWAHPGRIAVGIDARDGRVAVEGWAQTTDMTVKDLARRFEDAGVAAIIFTDISRDGMGAGVNAEATVQLAENLSIPVIASGGVASLADIETLASIPRLEGAVIGRAFYDGGLDTRAALACAARQSANPKKTVNQTSHRQTVEGTTSDAEPERRSLPFRRTRYFARVFATRPDRSMIRPSMIMHVLGAPVRREREDNGRIRLWGYIAELEQWLRVVTLPDEETVHNVFLDRDFTP